MKSFPFESSPPTVSHYFALQLQRITAALALSGANERYEQFLRLRQRDWLTAIINQGSERLTCELRLLSQPRANAPGHGEILLALLCRVDGTAAEAALELKRIADLCQVYFDDEYEFAAITDARQLHSLRQPFVPGAAVELLRRSERIALDTFRHEGTTPRLGFSQPPAAPSLTKRGTRKPLPGPPGADSHIYHVYPFLPSDASWSLLLRLLLRQPEPLAISIRLRPTRLGGAGTGSGESEEQFLEHQIARCELFAQTGLENPWEMKALWPTLRERAQAFSQYLRLRLHTLADNAALIQTTIFAPQVVPVAVIDVLGAQVTQPAGSTDAPMAAIGGGYEFRILAGGNLIAAQENFASLELTLQADDLAVPAGRRLRYLFDSIEAVALFRLPEPPLDELPGLPIKTARTRLAPTGLSSTGQIIGMSHHNNYAQPVRLGREDRRRHLYAVGQTGTGKTTLFESMILSDVRAGEGVCVMDPHGDLIEKLLPKIPQDRAEDVVLLDPSDTEHPVGLNILEYETEEQKHFLIQELLAIIERILRKLDPAMGGPVFQQHSRMILQLVMSNPNEPGTLAQFYQVFLSKNYYKRFLPLKDNDALLTRFVNEVLTNTDYTRVGYDGSSMGGYISSKFEPFLGDPMLRLIFGQGRSTIRLREIMDTGKILLVNLSKGRIGEMNARFFGMVLVAKLQAAAMARATMPMDERRDFYLYVDEFQNLATQNFSVLLAEARKYRLNLILTNQFITQLDSEIISAITGNVGSLISFRVGALDAEMLERDFLPTFNRYDLMNLPNFHTCVTTLLNGEVCRPFSMQTYRDESPGDEKRGKALRQLSRLKYGRTRSSVETEITDSLHWAQ